MDLGTVSVVIPAHNEGENLVDTVACLLRNNRDAECEVVVVDDGSNDGSGERVRRDFASTGRVKVIRGQGLGVGGARNRGAGEAAGDILVFLDGHCFTPLGWLNRLTAPLSDPRVGTVVPAFTDLSTNGGARGVGVVWKDASLDVEWLPQCADRPYAVPLLPGGCQAMRRHDFERFGQFEPRMTRWGSEGQEQSLRIWLLGYEVLAEPRAVVYHLFRKHHPYQVDPLGVIYNRILTAMLHLSWERIGRVLDYYKMMPEFSRLVTRLIRADVMGRRRHWLDRRVRDDDWYFARFGCML